MQKINSSFRIIPQGLLRRTFATSKQAPSVDPRHSRLIILGAGFSGLVASAYIPKISKINNFEIKMFEPRLNSYYTPNLDLAAFNIKSFEQIERPVLQSINNAINIEFSNVESINPANNTIVTSDKREYTYDYLVLATGLNQNSSEIAGLQEAIEDRDEAVVSTNTPEEALKCKRKLESFMAGNVIIYNDEKAKPASALNQTLLLDNFLRERGTGLRQMSNLEYVTSGRTIFPLPKQSLKVQDIFREKGIGHDNFSLKLVEVDSKNKKAIFQDNSNKRIEKNYDLLFVNPKQELPKPLQNLANSEGYLQINPQTLIHEQYSNILALGQCTRSRTFIPSRKSTMEQGTILSYNLKLILEAASKGTRPERLVKTTGATEIPLFVGSKECWLAQLDPRSPDLIGETSTVDYLKEAHVLPEIYFRLLSKGLWFENTGFRAPSLNTL